MGSPVPPGKHLDRPRENSAWQLPEAGLNNKKTLAENQGLEI